LGLSIVKGIVDSHQGLVFECGKEGVGATFVILLPMEE
jgi:signal transduction histidine kinase